MPAERRRRRKASGDAQSSPNWLFTYSDLVTLLLAFFILLFTFSNLDAERFRSIMAAFQGAIGVLDQGTTISRRNGITSADSPWSDLVLHHPLELEETRRMLESLSAFQREHGLEQAFELITTERGVIVQFNDRVLFDTGRTVLRPEAEEVLRLLAVELQEWTGPIRVEGHTDNVPIHNELFPSNWELSAARATRVVRFLVDEGGLVPSNLVAAGYGEYRPIASNQTAEGRARNRRVDVLLLRGELTISEPRATLGREHAPIETLMGGDSP